MIIVALLIGQEFIVKNVVGFKRRNYEGDVFVEIGEGVSVILNYNTGEFDP